MAISRYRNVRTVLNANEEYTDIITKRGVDYISHYSFSEFKSLKIRDLEDVFITKHIWTTGDRYYKLADKHYNDSLYWWVIALFNQKPLETDVKTGDIILIPKPLEIILSAMDI